MAGTGISGSRDRDAGHLLPQLRHPHAAKPDPCRHVQRQRPGTARQGAIPPEELALSRKPRRPRGDAGGGGLRALHPSPCRSRGLEHAPARRPLGPHLPKRALPVRPRGVGVLAGGIRNRTVHRRSVLRGQHPAGDRGGAGGFRVGRPRDRRVGAAGALARPHAGPCLRSHQGRRRGSGDDRRHDAPCPAMRRTRAQQLLLRRSRAVPPHPPYLPRAPRRRRCAGAAGALSRADWGQGWRAGAIRSGFPSTRETEKAPPQIERLAADSAYSRFLSTEAA